MLHVKGICFIVNPREYSQSHVNRVQLKLQLFEDTAIYSVWQSLKYMTLNKNHFLFAKCYIPSTDPGIHKILLLLTKLSLVSLTCLMLHTVTAISKWSPV